jgi:hypothetical protein
MAAAPPDLLDRKTSRSICDAVGERLQRDWRPDTLPSSAHIEHLLDTMRRQERDSGVRSAGDNRRPAGRPVLR